MTKEDNREIAEKSEQTQRLAEKSEQTQRLYSIP